MLFLWFFFLSGVLSCPVGSLVQPSILPLVSIHFPGFKDQLSPGHSHQTCTYLPGRSPELPNPGNTLTNLLICKLRKIPSKEINDTINNTHETLTFSSALTHHLLLGTPLVKWSNPLLPWKKFKFLLVCEFPLLRSPCSCTGIMTVFIYRGELCWTLASWSLQWLAPETLYIYN